MVRSYLFLWLLPQGKHFVQPHLRSCECSRPQPSPPVSTSPNYCQQLLSKGLTRVDLIPTLSAAWKARVKFLFCKRNHVSGVWRHLKIMQDRYYPSGPCLLCNQLQLYLHSPSLRKLHSSKRAEANWRQTPYPKTVLPVESPRVFFLQGLGCHKGKPWGPKEPLEWDILKHSLGLQDWPFLRPTGVEWKCWS